MKTTLTFIITFCLYAFTVATLRERNLQVRQSIVMRLAEKYCPFYGFDGPYCPQAKEGNENPQMLSGLGYDRTKRSLRWPVLTSSPAAAAAQQLFSTSRYPTPKDYLSFVFSEAQSRMGGLYANDDAIIKQIVSQFNDYRQNIAVSQKTFKFYAGNVASQQPQDYVLEYLKTIPPVYDPNNATLVYDYNQLIQEFGTEVTTATDFGGVIYLLAAIKACYGGVINGDIEKEIDNLINKEPVGPYAYLKYRKLGIYDVKGGNPEITLQEQSAQRIASMQQNPVVVQFSSVPLWQVIPAPWQEPVKAAIADYLNKFQPTVDSWVASAESLKVESYKAGQPITIFHRNTEQCCDYIIRDTACPLVQRKHFVYVPRFSIPRWNINIAANQVSEFDSYVFRGARLHWAIERDANGLARVHGWSTAALSNNLTETQSERFSNSKVEKRSNTGTHLDLEYTNGDVYSPFVHSGCADVTEFYVTTHPERHTYYTVCIDCQSYVTQTPAQQGVQHSDVQCGCAGF
ncbi:Prf1 [Acrasis kona]|uniref:Prf1 n=1 Tax=Acrasis kona TaxID=1008807 RepID=A0AAW2ZG51_9EUKA